MNWEPSDELIEKCAQAVYNENTDDWNSGYWATDFEHHMWAFILQAAVQSGELMTREECHALVDDKSDVGHRVVGHWMEHAKALETELELARDVVAKARTAWSETTEWHGMAIPEAGSIDDLQEALDNYDAIRSAHTEK